MRLAAGDRVASLTVLPERSDEADALVNTLHDLDAESNDDPKAAKARSNGRGRRVPTAAG
jgi:hypothetical protein